MEMESSFYFAEELATNFLNSSLADFKLEVSYSSLPFASSISLALLAVRVVNPCISDFKAAASSSSI